MFARCASLCFLSRTLHAFREFIQGQVPIFADFHKYLRYWFIDPFQDPLCLHKSSSIIGPPKIGYITHMSVSVDPNILLFQEKTTNCFRHESSLSTQSPHQRDQENVHKRSPASLLCTDINCCFENLVYRIVSQQINYFSGFLFILPAFV